MANERTHWHRPPANATLKFIEAAEFTSTEKGVRTAIELIAYPAGHVQVACSRVTGNPGKRTITQVAELMFNDMDEAKDAVDRLLDRLNREAR